MIPSSALVVWYAEYANATGSSAAFDLRRYLQFGVRECRVLVRVVVLICLTYFPRTLFVSTVVTLGVGFHLDIFPLRLYSWCIDRWGHIRVSCHG